MSILFSLCDQQITNSLITSNGTFEVFVSPPYDNNSAKNSMRAVCTFSNPVPADGNPEPTGYSISCVIEGRLNADNWYPLAYHFESWRNFDNGSQKIIVLQPNLSSIDAGIDDVVWVGGKAQAMISRQQGQCSEDLRLRVLIQETKHGTAEAFQSIHLEVKGELFDA